jgi:hypothetical protein
MPTEMEKLRKAKVVREEKEAKVTAGAKAALAPSTPGAVIPPSAVAQAAATAVAPGGAAPQMQDVKVTIVGVLKVRNEDGTERGVSQDVTLKIPVGFPKAQYEMLMPQVWNVILKQVGGLQNKNDDGSFTFYKDELFERYGATFHEVVGVSV